MVVSVLDLVPIQLFSCLFFTLLNLTIHKYRLGYNNLVKRTEEREWVWKNISCSVVHSVIVGVYTLKW